MSIEAMKQALEALERGRSQIIGVLVQQDQDEAISALRQAIEQAEKQEPVAWIVDGEIKVRLDMAGKLYYSETNVYSAPREWVSLTDEERFLDDARSAEEIEYAKAIEAKLREKNT